MATSDENRFWADHELRAKFFDWDPATGWYRRFFDIGELGGVRVEDDDVFETTHAKVLELVGDGLVQGLRIDHPDGLADPRGYLERLRRAASRTSGSRRSSSRGELRDWPVEGTTGYEFANDVTALFVDPARRGAADRALRRADGGERRPFDEVAHEAKLEQARTTFRQEFDRLRASATARARGGRCGAARLPHLRRALERTRRGGRPRGARRPAGPKLRRVLLLETSRRPMCPQAQPSSSRGSSRRPGPSWPRASRTRRSTAGSA